MVRWLKTNGFGKKEFKHEAQEIAYLLSTILFKYKSENLKKKYPDFLSFFAYYESNWFQYLEDGSIDYTKLTKLQ